MWRGNLVKRNREMANSLRGIVTFSEHFELDRYHTALDEAEFFGGADSDINDTSLDKGTAVVDGNNIRFVVN